MAEISQTRRGELVHGIFHTLLPHPDGLPAKLVLERLSAVVPPTSFEQSTYPKRPDIRRYEKIARFSTIGAVKDIPIAEAEPEIQPDPMADDLHREAVVLIAVKCDWSVHAASMLQ